MAKHDQCTDRRNAPILVGRVRELGLLRDHLHATFDGQGSLVLVSGEAGVGKTALTDALVREAAGRGSLVLVGHCYDRMETPPYGPWLDLFMRYQAGDGLPPLPATFARRGTISAVASQAVLFNQVLDFLRSLATTRPEETRPLVLVLEDLHWSDPASLDLLRFVARAHARLPLLIIVTYRSDELTREHPLSPIVPLLVREGNAARLDLRRLDEGAVRAYVAGSYALEEGEATELVRYLHRRSEGNPLFMTELLRTLEEEGVLHQEGGWSFGALPQPAVPLLLRQVIEARLARLDAGAQRLLAIAAMIGQEVPLTLWQRVGDADEEALLDLVERAVAARVLEETADGAGVTFVHALIREALYEGMPASRRRLWHRVIAEALIATDAPDSDAVAYHLAEAADPRAAGWLIRAGERAQQAGAWQTAGDRYRAALGLMRESEETASDRGWLLFALARIHAYVPGASLSYLADAAHLADIAADRVLDAAVRYYLSFIRYYAGESLLGIAEQQDAVAALTTLSTAERLILRGRRRWIGRALDEDNGEGQLAFILAQTGRYAEARPLAERLAARRAAAPREAGEIGGTTGDADSALQFVYVGLGMPDAAREVAERARAAFGAMGAYDDVARTGWVDLVWTIPAYDTDDLEYRRQVQETTWRAWLCSPVSLVAPEVVFRMPLAWVEGRWAEMRTHAETLPLGSVTLEIIPRRELAPIAYAQGDTDLVWKIADQVLPHGPETEPGGTNFLVALVLQQLAAHMVLDAGDLDGARRWLEMHDRWLDWGGAVIGRAESQLGWAAYYRAMGDDTTAHGRALAAVCAAGAPRQPLVLLAAHRLLGELATAAGHYDAAEEQLDEAAALADACAAPHERALTLLARAELRAATDDTATAQALVEETRLLCAPLGALPTLARAAALAARLASQPIERAAPFPDGLTAREVEVLRLLAAGLSNRAIGEALFINARTAERHISNIYAKIGVSSRAEAATYAVRHGLA